MSVCFIPYFADSLKQMAPRRAHQEQMWPWHVFGDDMQSTDLKPVGCFWLPETLPQLTNSVRATIYSQKLGRSKIVQELVRRCNLLWLIITVVTWIGKIHNSPLFPWLCRYAKLHVILCWLFKTQNLYIWLWILGKCKGMRSFMYFFFSDINSKNILILFFCCFSCQHTGTVLFIIV